MAIERCAWLGSWATATDPIYRDYHDTEWGVPSFNDQHLFEMLLLEGAQAGLSWITILKKRSAYRHAFAEFDASVIAGYGDEDINRLLGNAGIIRNRAKILAAIGNAKTWLALCEQHGGAANWLWQFVDGKPIQNYRQSIAEVPATTKTSDLMARELKKLGFRFVGSTTCYAFMQSVGMVNDHTVNCHRHDEILKLANRAD